MDRSRINWSKLPLSGLNPRLRGDASIEWVSIGCERA